VSKFNCLSKLWISSYLVNPLHLFRSKKLRTLKNTRYIRTHSAWTPKTDVLVCGFLLYWKWKEAVRKNADQFSQWCQKKSRKRLKRCHELRCEPTVDSKKITSAMLFSREYSTLNMAKIFKNPSTQKCSSPHFLTVSYF